MSKSINEILNDNRNQTARSETLLNNLRKRAKYLKWTEVTKNVYKTSKGNHIHLTGFDEKNKKYFFEKVEDIPTASEFDELSTNEKQRNGLFIMTNEKAKKGKKSKKRKSKKRKSKKRKSKKRKSKKRKSKRKKSK